MRWRNSLLVLLCVCSVQAAHVVTQTGRKIDGVKIQATKDGAVTLTTATGQRLTFQTGQYREAVADRPSELAKAEQMLAAGQGDDAVPLLEKVAAEYRFLAWDQTAALLLGNYLFETGRFTEAAAAFRLLENRDPQTEAKLREAMVKSGDTAAVLNDLEKEIATGSREAAARAYLLRGDLKAASGDAAGARRDWRKIALFFRAQKELAEEAERKLDEEERE